MANKRQLKKSIHNACGDVAFALFLTDCVSDSDQEKGLDILEAISKLQSNSLTKVSVSFDKAPKSFENKHLYSKARKQYYAKAYNELQDEFVAKLQTIVNEINEILNKNK